MALRDELASGEVRGQYRYDYAEYRQMTGMGYGFAALIMAAYAKADTKNAARLRLAFPTICEELDARYNAPGGLLPGEGSID